MAFQNLLNVLGTDSPACHHPMLPILQQALGSLGSKEPEILEDGLQLWLVALRNAPGPQPTLLELFPHLITAMAASTEFIQFGMQVTVVNN